MRRIINNRLVRYIFRDPNNYSAKKSFFAALLFFIYHSAAILAIIYAAQLIYFFLTAATIKTMFLNMEHNNYFLSRLRFDIGAIMVGAIMQVYGVSNLFKVKSLNRDPIKKRAAILTLSCLYSLWAISELFTLIQACHFQLACYASVPKQYRLLHSLSLIFILLFPFALLFSSALMTMSNKTKD